MGTQKSQESQHLGSVVVESRAAAGTKRFAGNLVGDEGIAVAVAADPGAEAKQGGKGEAVIRVVPRQGPFKIGQRVWHGIEQRLLKEVQPPGDLLGHRRLLQPDLAGEPKQIDLILERLGDFRPLPRCPALALELDKVAIDPAVDFQDGDPFGLRRMRRDDWRNHRAVQEILDPLRLDTRRRGFGEGPVETALYRVRAAQRLDPPAQPRLRDVLGDTQEVEPDALGLQSIEQMLLARHVPAQQDAFDPGTACPNHFEQQAEEALDDGLEVVALGGGERVNRDRRGLGLRLPAGRRSRRSS